ncbi:MAG: winged helix-turn-helix domain-containing protein [Candidatus Aenigmarchaeota archaeon]|nr:winged helix-turn-helix domain-containing protein [Candidatus Aenigmarchaeota archaeon]
MNQKEIVAAMSSKTKFEIIRHLSKGQKTPTDISRALGKAKSTIVEHLEELVELDLVQKTEQPGRKFVFYSLTKNGYRLLESKPKIENFVMFGSFLSILAGIVLVMSANKSVNRLYAASAESTQINYIPILFFVIGAIGIIYLIFRRLKK